MNEMLLQFIWDQQLVNAAILQTTLKEKIEVLYPGKWNQDQGPDFSGARIQIGQELWIGQVEIHVNSSDWEKHGHQNDQNYENVILHVVWKDDSKLISKIPVMELQPYVPSYILKKHSDWMWKKTMIPCSDDLARLNQSLPGSFIRWLTEQRFLKRADMAFEKVKALGMDWQEAFWRAISRNFGYKVNADAFESIASSLPYKTLLKLRHEPRFLEALLLGQAGLLRADISDDYARHLWKDYIFLKKKYSLAKSYIPVHFLRMRPINFPTIRLSQLAALIFEQPDFFSVAKEAQDPAPLKKILKVSAAHYWENHYRFNEISEPCKKILGEQLINSLIVNTVVPFVIAYNTFIGNINASEILHWLDDIPAEHNNIISNFANTGLKSNNMNDTQGLLELHSQYCTKGKCSKCAIGQFLLKKNTGTIILEIKNG